MQIAFDFRVEFAFVSLVQFSYFNLVPFSYFNLVHFSYEFGCRSFCRWRRPKGTKTQAHAGTKGGL